MYMSKGGIAWTGVVAKQRETSPSMKKRSARYDVPLTDECRATGLQTQYSTRVGSLSGSCYHGAMRPQNPKNNWDRYFRDLANERKARIGRMIEDGELRIWKPDEMSRHQLYRLKKRLRMT